MNKKYIKNEFSVSDDILTLVEECEEKVADQFKLIDEIAEVNQIKVMKAFSDKTATI